MQSLIRLVALALAVVGAVSWGAATRASLPQDKGEQTKLPFRVEDKLTADDPKDKVNTNSPHKIHKVQLEAGKTYVIDMMSPQGDLKALDPFLRLEDPDRKELAKDDDGGDFLNARIVFKCERAGEYRVIATSFSGSIGNYILTVALGPGQAGESETLKFKEGVAELTGKLAGADPKHAKVGGPYRVYTIELMEGRTYQIDMTSNDFDAYLFVQNPAGTDVAEDDDSGGMLNSRITYRCPSNGTYRILAASLGGRLGGFNLRVAEQK